MVLIIGTAAGFIFRRFARNPRSLGTACGFLAGGFLGALICVVDAVINRYITHISLYYLLFPLFYGGLLSLITILPGEIRNRVKPGYLTKAIGILLTVIGSIAAAFISFVILIFIINFANIPNLYFPLIMGGIFALIALIASKAAAAKKPGHSTWLFRVLFTVISSVAACYIAYGIIFLIRNDMLFPLVHGGLYGLASIITYEIKGRGKPLIMSATKTRGKRRKVLGVVLKAVFGSLVGIYMVLIVVVNWSLIRLADLNELGVGSGPLIAFDTPARNFPLRQSTSLQSNNGWYDVRFINSAGADWSDREDELMRAHFSNRTVWPDLMPEGFSPNLIMEMGLNPGLGVRKLHERGITGAGAGVAIIDASLIAGHIEYTDTLRLYEQYYSAATESAYAAMHSFVASMAVGKNSGVAPGADLYYLSGKFGYFVTPFWSNHNYLAAAIDRILEINGHLPQDEKIRVISISKGFALWEIGAMALRDAINRANEAGIFVITTSPEHNFDFTLMGLGREPLDEPDDFTSYTPGSWWSANFFRNYPHFENLNMLLVPMDSRAGASWTGETDYIFQRTGGLSWSVPWLAGMYALCVQVYPDITPELFISLAFETGDSLQITENGALYTLQTIINPIRLIERLEILGDSSF